VAGTPIFIGEALGLIALFSTIFGRSVGFAEEPPHCGRDQGERVRAYQPVTISLIAKAIMLSRG
jgi:hypothetical protein